MMISKIIKNALAVVFVGGLLFGAGANAASAATVAAGGGTHTYGVRSGGIYGSGGQVYSEYLHPSKTHKASACAANACAVSGWSPGNIWATAYKSPMATVNNKAYYDYK